MPESARFYVVKGEMDKAEKVIRRIAWYNCRHPPKVCACSPCVSVPCLFLPAYHTEGYTTMNVHVKITDYLSNDEVTHLPTLQVGDFSTRKNRLHLNCNLICMNLHILTGSLPGN